MKYIGRVDQSRVNLSVVDAKSRGMMKRLATACLVASLGVVAFASQPVAAEEGRLGGFSLEDQSMLGHYGDVNDEWVAASTVEVSKSRMNAETKKTMPKKDSRLGAYSMQDKAMLGRYGDMDDGY
ncbi:hypothetical protein [Kaarinaea lacus]